MTDDQQRDRNAPRQSVPAADRGDVTPPHGDELGIAPEREGTEEGSDLQGSDDLRREGSFGRTDRYANQDAPDAEPAGVEDATLVSDEELRGDARQRRMERLDDAAADDARMAVRKREHSAE